MILVIRIAGQVKIPGDVDETLYRMNIRKKYTATILENNKVTKKLLNKVRNFVAYGEIDDELLQKILEKRGKRVDKKKIDSEKAVKEISKKSLREQGIKPFFGLHPPLKGIDSKKHFGVGKGVLGNNGKEIKKLVERML